MNDSTYIFSIILNIRCVHLSFNPTRFTSVYISFVKAQSFARDPAHFLVYGLKCCESFISDQAYHTCKVNTHIWHISIFSMVFIFGKYTILVPWIRQCQTFGPRQSQVHARWSHLLPGFWAHGSCSCPHHGGLR